MDKQAPAGFWASGPGVRLAAALRFAPRFSGRASRTELLWTFAVAIAAAIPLIAVVEAGPPPREASGIWLTMLLSLPCIDVVVRRLHDSSRSGWQILAIFAPYIGIFLLGWLLFLEGDAGENPFGPDPRGTRT